jgi:hypothetical protein
MKEEIDGIFEKWTKETDIISNYSIISNHKYVNDLLKLDNSCLVNYFIDNLNEEKHMLYSMIVLHKIYKYSPIKPENRGRISKMKEDWLNYLNNINI